MIGLSMLRAVAVLADDPNHLGNSPDTSCSCASQLTAIIGYIAWVVTAIAILALIGVGMHWVLSTRHGEQENLNSLGRWGAGALLAGAAGPIANTMFGFNLFSPHPQAIPGLTAVQHWLNIVTFIAIAVAVIGLLLCGGRAMLRFRQGEPLGEPLVYVLVGCFFIASASSVTYAVLPW
jgi:uncharacterized membrane protein YidH (DUF202 family)